MIGRYLSPKLELVVTFLLVKAGQPDPLLLLVPKLFHLSRPTKGQWEATCFIEAGN